MTWPAGTTGPLTSRFTRFPVWCAPAYQRGGPFAPRAEICLGEWPAPTKYWLADLRGEPCGLRRLVRLAKGRWRIEQDHRELKDELGLDHFEGRSWTGWHHHATLVSMAYAFLVLEGARAKKTPLPTLPRLRRQLQHLLLRLGEWCPWCGSQLPYDTSET